MKPAAAAPRSLMIASFARGGEVLAAVRALQGAGLSVHDVLSPCPIHGLDDALGLRPSRLPWVAAAAGLAGLAGALALQFYASVWDWPLNVGGKPPASTLAFIPVAFEATILAAGLAAALAFAVRCRLAPRLDFRPLLPEITDHLFAIALDRGAPGFDEAAARRILVRAGARDIRRREVAR